MNNEPADGLIDRLRSQIAGAVLYNDLELRAKICQRLALSASVRAETDPLLSPDQVAALQSLARLASRRRNDAVLARAAQQRYSLVDRYAPRYN